MLPGKTGHFPHGCRRDQPMVGDASQVVPELVEGLAREVPIPFDRHHQALSRRCPKRRSRVPAPGLPLQFVHGFSRQTAQADGVEKPIPLSRVGGAFGGEARKRHGPPGGDQQAVGPKPFQRQHASLAPVTKRCPEGFHRHPGVCAMGGMVFPDQADSLRTGVSHGSGKQQHSRIHEQADSGHQDWQVTKRNTGTYPRFTDRDPSGVPGSDKRQAGLR